MASDPYPKSAQLLEYAHVVGHLGENALERLFGVNR